MFDGSFKSSRKVSLSGRRKPAAGLGAGSSSRQELVQQAKLAREQRQELKARAAAGAKLQALARRVSVARRARAAVFQQLEAEVARIAAAQDIRQAPLATAALSKLLRQFLFAVPAALEDRKRAVDAVDVAVVGSSERLQNVQTYLVVMLLVSCLRGSREQGNNVLLAVDKDATWAYQVARVLEMALEQVAQLDFADPAAAANPYLVLLNLFTRVESYGTDSSGAISAQDAEAYARLMARLAVDARFGTFQALSAIISRAQKHSNIQELAGSSIVIQAVAKASAATLQIALSKESRKNAPLARRKQQIVSAFARTILLTPLASSSPIVQVFALPNANDPVVWTSALQSILNRFSHQDNEQLSSRDLELSWRDRAALVGNTIDLMDRGSFHPGVVLAGVSVISRYISPTLARWAFNSSESHSDAIALAPEEVDDVSMLDSDPSDLHGDTRLQLAAAYLSNTIEAEEEKTAQSGITALGDDIEAVRAQWQSLCFSSFSAKCLEAILASLASGQHSTAPKESLVLDFSHVFVCVMLSTSRSYVLRVSTSFASPSAPVFAMLSALSTDNVGPSSVISRLWLWLNAQKAAYRWGSGARDSGLKTPSPRFLEALVVFNVVYSHTLLGLDDEAFYNREWPLRVSDVADLVSFLNRFLYDSCWNNTNNSVSRASGSVSSTPSNDELALFAAVTSSVKLYNQLYDRDCRRTFAPEGAWLWPSMPAIKETVDFSAMSEDSTTQGTPAVFLLLKGLASSSASSSAYSRMALVLSTVPQVLSFNDRVQLFQKLLDEDKLSLSSVRDEFHRAIKVRIRRSLIVDDSFDFFQEVCGTASTGTPLKSRIKVTFINEQGLEEAGIDGGGVFKEYVDQLTKHAFSPEYGYFLATDDEQQMLYPNPAVEGFVVDSRQQVVDRFRFLGRVLAKAVYENILVEPQFAAFFLNKLLGRFNYIDDLQSLDPALYRSLMSLKHIDDEQALADLALTFSVTERAYGQVVTRDLVPNGANIPVTNSNKIRYMHVLANYKLNVQSSLESAAFLRGFRDLIPAPWIQMFSPAELQMLIGGSANKVDVDDWERNTMYGGGYHPSQPIIQWFWSLVRDEFSPTDRAALLKFITSCSRQPLLGFGQLAPQICIHQVRVDDDDRLPSSATCMNLLKLPTYSSKEAMRKKLLYAIRANAGFDLS